MAQILSFYAELCRFQDELYAHFADRNIALSASGLLDLPALLPKVPDFLDLLARHGTPPLKRTAEELKSRGEQAWKELLSAHWQGREDQLDAQRLFMCRAFLQPVAEFSRDHSEVSLKDYSDPICPYCGRRPAAAVLRPEGEGGKRSLQCSFCLGEWNFRRILCPACGEEDNRKLPVYTADDFDYVRVEACDTCKRYIKSVDLTKNGRAEPVVDEIAAAALDLWARDHGYSKIELNLMGM